MLVFCNVIAKAWAGHSIYILEPVCCKKLQKKVPAQLLVCGIGGPLKILNGIKLILDDQGNQLDSYTISLESFRSFRGPLFP